MSDRPKPLGGIFIPAHTFTPEEMAEFLLAYAESQLPHVVEFYRRMARPGVVFSAEQQAQLQALFEAGQKAEAQRIILDQMKEEFGDG